MRAGKLISNSIACSTGKCLYGHGATDKKVKNHVLTLQKRKINKFRRLIAKFWPRWNICRISVTTLFFLSKNCRSTCWLSLPK